MTLQRGDVVTTRIPHAGGNRGKKRPAVVIQADSYNVTLKHFIVAEITKNLAAATDPASFLIDISTPDGQGTGLDQDSVVCCLFLATVAEDRITQVIGRLSPRPENAIGRLPEGGTRAAVTAHCWVRWVAHPDHECEERGACQRRHRRLAARISPPAYHNRVTG